MQIISLSVNVAPADRTEVGRAFLCLVLPAALRPKSGGYSMALRKEWKQKGRQTLKSHYALCVILCMLAIFVTGEFRIGSTLLSEQTPVQNTIELSNSLEVEVLRDIFKGNYEKASEKAQKLLADYADGDNESSELGNQRGVLASFVNDFSSGHFLVKVALSVFTVVQNPKLASGIVMLLTVTAYGVIWAFIFNCFKAMMRRMFLEARRYPSVPIYHVLFIPAIRRWRKATLTMLVTYLFQALWNLTIIGGIIKHYSYFCVPYIVGENPDISPLQAIRLSRKMMDGHKWECFLLDLSFIGWDLLGIGTMGLSNIFYTIPFRMTAFAEYFVYVRGLAKKAQIEGIHELDDIYLYELASVDDLEWFYQDIVEDEKYLAENHVVMSGKQRVCAKWFSIWIDSRKKKLAWQKQRSMEIQVERERATMEQKCYPTRLHPLWPKGGRKLRSGSITYMRCYTVWSLIVMFFVFAGIGWIWEVMLHFLETGVIVNRGTMLGPWLPIYGAGGLIVLSLCTCLRSNPIAELMAAMGLCGVIEYITSWFLELKYGLRWWDYTGYFLNLNGRICAEGLLIFGIGSGIVVYLIAPVLDEMISKIKDKVIVPVCLALLLMFNMDLVHSVSQPNSGHGVTDIEAGGVE